MAEFTKNLNIEKPAGNENFKRGVLNANMDKIDDMFGIEEGKGHVHNGTAGQGKKISYGDLKDKPATMPPSAHKAAHSTGGADALTPADIGAASAATVSALLTESVKVRLSDTEPAAPDQNTYWYRIGSFSGGTEGGDGVSIANAVTGDDPPPSNQYWFDIL